MYIHRLSQYNFPEDIDKKFDFMYEAKQLATEIYLQEINPQISIGRINTEKSFHYIMWLTRNTNTHPFWLLTVQKNNFDNSSYLNVYLKVKDKEFDYFIFMKIDRIHLSYLIKQYHFKKVNLKMLK